MGFDLHNHSSFSDGIFSPATLVEEGKRLGLEGLSLTDHDTLNGLDEFMQAGREAGVIAIPGVEITSQYHKEEIHILGYWIDPDHSGLRCRLEQVINSRIERAKEMVHLLQKAGVELTWEDLERVCTDRDSNYIGRPHLYRALKAKGIIGEDPERLAFRYYLGTHGVAYVPHHELPTLEALELVRAAGGFPVLAHPGRLENYDLVKTFKDSGLAGIEVFYPTHSSQHIAELLQISSKLGLFPTGGSDYHGEPGGTKLGAATVERRYIEPLLRKVQVKII